MKCSVVVLCIFSYDAKSFAVANDIMTLSMIEGTTLLFYHCSKE